MLQAGYLRYPTLQRDQLVFVAEDDLFLTTVQGGPCQRLTTSRGPVSYPVLSPSGRGVAYVGQEEGASEVYWLDLEGGPPKRLTYLGAGNCFVLGFQDQEIIFATSAHEPFTPLYRPYALDPDTGVTRELATGPARFVSFGPQGGVVIARHSGGRFMGDPAFWKHYRGGTKGDLWIDRKGNRDFEPLINLEADLAAPLWLGDRIYFISDHEGTGNLYSCDLYGGDLRCHTHHRDFYARNPQSDGRRIVYHAGGEIFLFDPVSRESHLVPIEFYPAGTQRQRKFVPAIDYLEYYSLASDNPPKLAIAARGSVVSLGAYSGGVKLHSPRSDARYRMPVWLAGNKQLVVVSDAGGEEGLEVVDADQLTPPRRLRLELGRIVDIFAAPVGLKIAVTNHRNELFWVDLESDQATKITQSPYGFLGGVSFSPDGAWIAYSTTITRHTSGIYLYEIKTGRNQQLGEPVLADFAPAFDPGGRYLYFLSRREFNPSYDALRSELFFGFGTRGYAAVLRDQFLPPDAEALPAFQENFAIDLEGISERIVPLAFTPGNYNALAASPTRVFVTQTLLAPSWEAGPPGRTLLAQKLGQRKIETWATGIDSFDLAGSRLAYRRKQAIRIVDTEKDPSEEPKDKSPGPDSGFVELSRARVMANPALEWPQIFTEAWRLAREHYFDPDMNGLDWEAVYRHYSPLLDRIQTREELSDLMWELQGELGTSHAYVVGGDLPRSPNYPQGYLGAQFELQGDKWKIAQITKGDPANPLESSPLLAPGVRAQVGEYLVAVGGIPLGPNFSPPEALVDQGGREVVLSLVNAEGLVREVQVRTLRSEQPLLYRAWVNRKKEFVHQKSAGRAGYIHVPDMGQHGFGEFFRHFQSEIDRAGLVVDVRFNGGGNVSPLLLQALSRRRIAHARTRWFGEQPYPDDAPPGPMVALTNAYCGSDGDIFSHSFKVLGLGPLLGERSWGGVVGIWPRHNLQDRGYTTQPEFAFFFDDIGLGLENHGAEPDIEVMHRPQDDQAGRDPQLEAALEVLLERLGN